MEGEVSRTRGGETMNAAVIGNAAPYTTSSLSLVGLIAEGDSIPTFQPSRVWEFLAPTLFTSRTA